MSFRLSLKTSQPPPTTDAASPIQNPSSARPKIKLNASQPPTPAVEQPHSYISPATADAKTSKKGKKRAANGDLASPAAKRVASDANRRSSLILKLPSQRHEDGEETPQSAAPRIKLSKRQSSAPKLKRLMVKGRVPERVLGNAYDSEDSDRERDPATEQHVVLRMQPGEDCDILRKAIAERTIGLPAQEGGTEVTFKFLDRDLRRALITVRGHMYAAAVVDLPCIVETMKSWDKRGWWKVADISQMLLVLGRVQSEEQAKKHALPERVVNEKTWAFAHGLTPPMHWVRKRRFRKRLSYKDTANVEEEVNRLIADDEQAEREGGRVKWDIHSRESLERSEEPETGYGYDDDDGKQAVSTIENDDYDDGEEELEEMDVEDAEAQFQALFDQELEAEAASGNPQPTNLMTDGLTDSTIGVDSATATNHAFNSISQTPAGASAVVQTPAGEGDELFGDRDDDEEEESSDEDDDDDDEIDAYDEDAQARAAEQNIQQQEIQDLENEIKLQRQKLAATKNQLLLQRQREKLKSLEEDLQTKRRVYGLDDLDEDDEN